MNEQRETLDGTPVADRRARLPHGHSHPAALATTRRGLGRRSLIFAVVGMVIALIAGAAYVVKAANAPAPRSPEATVQEFLAGVFLAASMDRVGSVVCASWDPADAITRTAKEIESGLAVSWDEIRVATSTQGRATLRARLGLRRSGDVRPSSYQQWRFTVVDEKGWRVCDARPLVM